MSEKRSENLQETRVESDFEMSPGETNHKDIQSANRSYLGGPSLSAVPYTSVLKRSPDNITPDNMSTALHDSFCLSKRIF